MQKKKRQRENQRQRNVRRVVEVRRRDCWVTLPRRCDRGSSAYQIDGDCLAMAGGGREGGRDGGRERGGRGGGWQKSVCRLLLIPASLSEMIWEIILIILNAITVSPAPLPRFSPCRIKSMCHSM